MGQLVEYHKKLQQLTKDRAWLLEYYKSTECLCGNNKNEKVPFYYRCFKALPRDLQKPLYKHFGQGFEQAVNEAVIYLQKNEW